MNENRRKVIDTIVARAMLFLVILAVAGVLYFPSDSSESLYVVAFAAAGIRILAIMHFGGRFLMRARAVESFESRKA